MKYAVLSRFALLALSFASACSQTEKTKTFEIRFELDADQELRTRIDRVVIESEADSATFWPGAPKGMSGAVTWPFSMVGVARSDRAGGLISVRGFASEIEVVRRTARLEASSSVEGRVWRVYLTSSCEGVFESCDARGLGTCLPCGSSCEDASVAVSKLPKVSGAMDASVAPSDSPLCDKEDEGDGPDAGLDAGLDAGFDAGMDTGLPESGTDAEAGTEDSELTLDMPPVVAAPGCVALRVTRKSSSQTQNLILTSQGNGAFYTDAACTLPFDPAGAFALGSTVLDVYYAPILQPGMTAVRASMEATLGDTVQSTPIEIRLRTVQTVRNSNSHCALAQDVSGALYCVGPDSPAMAKRLDGLTPYSRLSSYTETTCALILLQPNDVTGEVRCWGTGRQGQLGNQALLNSELPVAPHNLGNLITQVRVGVEHACAIRQGGSLYCWGNNPSGIVDNSANEFVTAPTLSTHLSAAGETDAVAEVAPGWNSTCARTINDEVYCWGSGIGGFTAAARKVDLPLPAKQIAVGQEQACAITEGNKVYCWTGTTASRIFSPPDDVVLDRIAISFLGGCVASSTELYCWGPNPQGWLGTGSQAPTVFTPEKVNVPKGKINSFSVAGFTGVAASAVVDGLVYSWGFALDDGAIPRHALELGLGPRLTVTSNPALTTANSLAFSPYVSCMIDGNAAVSCWGRGIQLGNGQVYVADGALASTPTPLVGLGSGVTQVEVGTQWVAVLQNGVAKVWGGDATEQLGNGSAGASPTPTAMSFTDPVLDIGVSYSSGCALVQSAVNERKVFCWGAWGAEPLASPQLTLTGNNGLTDVDVQGSEGCALDNGSVKCWRNALTPALRQGMPNNVTKIEMDGVGSEGPYYSSLCALTSANTVFCSFNQDDAALTFSGATQLTVGAGHACIVKAGGLVECAGSNRAGQLGDGLIANSSSAAIVPGLTGVTAVQAGGDSSCAKDASGWKCWGSNTANELSLSSIVVATPRLISPWK